jgi:hypothetical protein
VIRAAGPANSNVNEKGARSLYAVRDLDLLVVFLILQLAAYGYQMVKSPIGIPSHLIASEVQSGGNEMEPTVASATTRSPIGSPSVAGLANANPATSD